jgi:hypothetical protein
MDDGQKTPGGHPNFNSYIKNLRVLVFQTDRQTDKQTQTDRQTDGRTDELTEKLIRVGLHNLWLLQVQPLRVGWRNFFPLS